MDPKPALCNREIVRNQSGNEELRFACNIECDNADRDSVIRLDFKYITNNKYHLANTPTRTENAFVFSLITPNLTSILKDGIFGVPESAQWTRFP